MLTLVAAGCEPAVAPAPKTPAPTLADDNDYSLTAFDVGTGLALLVRGADFSLLYDGGSNDDRRTGADNRLLAYLRLAIGPSNREGCAPQPVDSPVPRIDHVVLSHPHRDHMVLLPDVLHCYEVANVWESGLDPDNEGYRRFQDAIATSRHHRGGADFRAGTTFDLGRGAHAKVLSVRPGARDPNDASVVIRLDLGHSRVLLTGDATAGARRDPSSPPDRGSVEATLLEHPKELAADVLVVGHHGSKTSTRAAFLDAVHPKLAIISSGPMEYGSVVLPDPETIALLESRSVQILRTDEDDDACKRSPSKVGADDDGAPGGCSAVTVLFEHGRATPSKRFVSD